MASRWIKGFECLGCGSHLGRFSFNPESRRREPMCFVCCLGQYELHDIEVEGEDYEEVLKLIGREIGRVERILPRLNTPGSISSSHEGNKLYSLEYVKKAISIHHITPEFREFSPGLTSQLEALALSPILRSQKNKKKRS